MVYYGCPECGHRWKGLGRKPGEAVYCPKCGKRVYTYAKAYRPMKPVKVEG